jgi:hypothetical protein
MSKTALCSISALCELRRFIDSTGLLKKCTRNDFSLKKTFLMRGDDEKSKGGCSTNKTSINQE